MESGIQIWMGISGNDDGNVIYLVKVGRNGNTKCIHFPFIFSFKT